MANLPLVDTMHHALQAWCIFAELVLTRRDNGDKRDKTRCMLLFHSAVSMFFGVPQQIQESKRRNSQQISATLRVVNAKIIGILCNNNCCRRFFTQFYDRIIIRNWRTFSVFDFYKDIFRVGVVHHNINFFFFFTAPEVTNRCGILIWQYGQRRSHPVRKPCRRPCPESPAGSPSAGRRSFHHLRVDSLVRPVYMMWLQKPIIKSIYSGSARM